MDLPRSGLPWSWGATPEELARRYPADEMFDGPALPMTRAVSVAAPPALVYRWLCQIALAPYSYDLVDNLGRRSPQWLVPGTDDLRLGQRMTVFTLTGFEPGRLWTGETAAPGLGRYTVTYAAEPAAYGSRLIGRMVVPGGSLIERARGTAVAWGDLVMMRRQLLNLRALAERDAAAGIG